MTDNEILKAYEGLTANQQLNLYRNLYYNDGYATERGIIANAINDMLPKYHSQKVEIERLKKAENDEFCEIVFTDRSEAIKMLKTEAVKEFAERMKDEMGNCARIEAGETQYFVIGYSLIEKVVKEMTEDKNDR